MVVFGIFFLSPFLVGGAAEYLCCRLPKKRWWRWVPLPGASTVGGAAGHHSGVSGVEKAVDPTGGEAPQSGRAVEAVEVRKERT